MVAEETGMPVDHFQHTELERAYQVLGVPTDAAAPTIKHAYWKLIKRWHPDLYTNGTPEHVDATRMVGLLNEAYAAIAQAPLREPAETYTFRPSVAVGENKYREEWKRYRALRRRLCILMAVELVGLLPFISCVVFLDKQFFGAKGIFTFPVIVSWVIPGTYTLLRLQNLPCPRCHNSFIGAPFGNRAVPWGRKSCAYCGLPRGF